MRCSPIRAIALAFLLFANLLVCTPGSRAGAPYPAIGFESAENRTAWMGPATMGTFVRRVAAGGMTCLAANPDQAARIRSRNPNQPLTVLSDSDAQSQRPGLKIVLRGTSQSLNFPAAVGAIERAAGQWENVIQTNITIVIDVDFGPTQFGAPFDPQIAGIVDTQLLGGNAAYPAVRGALTTGGYAADKASLYNSLPAGTVPTDAGASGGMTATTATLRALALLDPVADAVGESSSFGLPPSIAFNSALDYDFDASDGIDPGKFDFQALVLHDIGHILGFVSFVGQAESDSSLEIEPSIFDLFRVRPTDPTGDFANLQRVISSGGEQDFFAGGTRVALSTARPDGSGGDGYQAAHWKSRQLSGRYVGVMDPAIAPGESQLLTDDDVAVLDAIGYRVRGVLDQTLVIPLVSGQAQTGGMLAPPPGLGVLSHTQYAIAVPAGATQVKFDLNGDQDVDLFVRFGAEVVLQGHNATTDYVSHTDSDSESITVTAASSPPLRPGAYFIAIANFGPGDASFTITATVTGGAVSHAPIVFNVSPSLEGDVLNLDYTAIDRDGDFSRANVTLLDSSGHSVGSAAGFAISSGNATRIEPHVVIAGLSGNPSASQVSLVLVDRAGNRSAEAVKGFGRPQESGLTLAGGSYNGAKLKLTARGPLDGLQLEVNGVIVTPPHGVNTSGSKLIIKGKIDQLGLHPGDNQIRLRNAIGWSNVLVLTI